MSDYYRNRSNYTKNYGTKIVPLGDDKMKLLLLLCFFSILSCTNKEPSQIDVSHTEYFASSPQWAVITEAYASYFTTPSKKSEINSYGREGEVISVEGIRIENRETWYKFEQGWLPQSSVTIYSNKLQATSAAK